LDEAGIKLAAVASTVVLTAINCRGVAAGALVQNLLTVLKMAALLALPLLAVGLGKVSGANLAPLWPAGGMGSVMLAAGPALVAALWAYDGWIESTYVGSEITNPQRNLPLSIVLSTAIVVFLYLVANATYLAVLSPARTATSTLVGSDAAQVILGPVGAAFIAGAIVIATLGANNGIVFTSARIPYAMAREGLFFQWAGRLDRRFQSPNLVLLVQGAVAVVLTMTGSYVQLATYVVFVSFLFYGLSALAVLVLRRTEPDLPRPYRAWGYPVTPLVFIAFALYLVTDTILQTPRESGVGAGLVLMGLPAYWYWRRAGGRTG
jgi:amino acid transporter